MLSGRLIHVSVGRSGGRGGLRTKRSGWAAYAVSSTPARFSRADFGGAVVDVGGRVKCQPGVAMLIVVPREEVLAVHARRLDRGEPAGEVGPVFQRLELRLAERVVVGDVRAANATG